MGQIFSVNEDYEQVDTPITINGQTISLEGGGGLVDTDGDGVSELQSADGADFGAKPLLAVSEVDFVGPNGTQGHSIQYDPKLDSLVVVKP